MGSSESSGIAEIFGGEWKIVEMGEDERTLQIYNLRSQSLKSPLTLLWSVLGIPSLLQAVFCDDKRDIVVRPPSQTVTDRVGACFDALKCGQQSSIPAAPLLVDLRELFVFGYVSLLGRC